MPNRESTVSVSEYDSSLEVLAKDSMVVIGTIDYKGNFNATKGAKGSKPNLAGCNSTYEAEEKLLEQGYGVRRMSKSVNTTIPAQSKMVSFLTAGLNPK